MFKYKDFETLNYMRDIVKSWTEKADSPAIIDNTDFLTGRQCAAIAKAAIDVMEANGTQRGDVVAFTQLIFFLFLLLYILHLLLHHIYNNL